MLIIPEPKYRRRRDRTRPAADVPTPPPEPAVVVSAAVDGTGLICTLFFDRPLTLAQGGPPWAMDGSITFDGRTPESVEHGAPDTLAFFMTDPVQGGSAWAIAAQPAWVVSPLLVPQNGTV